MIRALHRVVLGPALVPVAHLLRVAQVVVVHCVVGVPVGQTHVRSHVGTRVVLLLLLLPLALVNGALLAL